MSLIAKEKHFSFTLFSRNLLFVASLFVTILGGCATTETTPKLDLKLAQETLPISIAVGQFTDSRHRYKKGELATTQIQIGMNRIKNTAAQYLDDSRHFEQIINIPTSFFGDTLAQMINTTRKSKCEYLLVGEVDNFDIKILGHNRRAFLSAFLEPFATPSNLVVWFSTGAKGGVFFQGIIKDRTVEVNLSATVALIDIRNGSIIGNFTLDERGFDTINYLYYGDTSNPDDDWRDVGKNIGERIMANFFVNLVPKVAEKVKQDLIKKQQKREQQQAEEQAEEAMQETEEEAEEM